MVKVPLFGGFPVENPTNKATASKLFLKGISLSEYGSEGFRVRLRSLSEYGSVAYLVERPTRETRTEQHSDTVLKTPLPETPHSNFPNIDMFFVLSVRGREKGRRRPSRGPGVVGFY